MARRKFTREFKVSAVKLVTEQGYSVAQAAKSLGVDRNSLADWQKKFAAEPGSPAKGESALQIEVRRLREEVKRLTMEREILKKATAFFARQQP
jgi:transposase